MLLFPVSVVSGSDAFFQLREDLRKDILFPFLECKRKKIVWIFFELNHIFFENQQNKMATHFSNINLSELVIGPIETGNNGGKYKTVSYKNAQVKDVQLGESVYDTLRCPFGVEAVAPDQPNKLCIKLDAPEPLAQFIRGIDDAVIKSVNDSSLVHRSTLKTGTMNSTLKLKLPPDTQIFVTTLSNGKMTNPINGSKEDIIPGCRVLPIIKIQGGVYFVESNYGTSMVATQILIVKGGVPEPVAFNFGNVLVE